jgi:sugar/nucleoside kinase (ribokinase family)
MNELLQRGVKNIWLRKGAEGSEIINTEKSLELHAALINVKDSTGAGDAALAGWVAGYCIGMNKTDCLKYGHALAFEVLQVNGAIATSITKEKLLLTIKKYYPNEK